MGGGAERSQFGLPVYAHPLLQYAPSPDNFIILISFRIHAAQDKNI